MRASFHGYGRLVRATFFGTRGTFARLTFRRWIRMAVFLPAFLLLQVFHWIGFCLDDLLFPGYRNTTIDRPLFVLGVPRSGTTFLHRILARDTERFTTPMLWELIFAPSVTERRLLMLLGRIDRKMGRPGRRVVDRLQERFFSSLDAIHPVRLEDPEEDYFALLPVLACFLLVLPFPASEEIWRLSRFDDRVPAVERRRIAAFYRGIVQRHLYVRGPNKQLLSKNPSFTPMLRTLSEAFPDACMVACIRDPAEAIASELSAMVEGMHAFANDLRGTEFRDRIVAVMVHYYRHLSSALSRRSSTEPLFVSMESMKADLEGTVHRIYRRFGWSLSRCLESTLPAEAEKSRAYRSRHQYRLDQFQLTAEEIYRMAPDVFGRFGFGRAQRHVAHR